MPSIYELNTESDALIANEDDSEMSDSLPSESVSFVRPRDRLARRKRKQPVISRTAGMITLVFVIAIFLLALKPSPRRPYPKLPNPSDPSIEHLSPIHFQKYNSERVQIKYGPYSVPPSSIENGMKNFYEQDASMPCHDCLITWMQADIMYADDHEDGGSANAGTGMWLHHTVLTNAASKDVKGCRYNGERFFASGNERTIVDLTLNGTEKVGYYLSTTSTVWMMTEFMNMDPIDARDVTLTITYEYIPISSASSTPPISKDFARATPIWLDIGGCKDSEVPIPDKETKFEFVSPSWSATIKGRVISVLGHLHDGGTELDVKKGKESLCRSLPQYGDSDGDGGEGDRAHSGHDSGNSRGENVGLKTRHENGDMDMSHITQMSTCHSVGRMEIGEEWTVTADYDIALHPPMMTFDGAPEPIMGIAVVYIVED